MVKFQTNSSINDSFTYFRYTFIRNINLQKHIFISIKGRNKVKRAHSAAQSLNQSVASRRAKILLPTLSAELIPSYDNWPSQALPLKTAAALLKRHSSHSRRDYDNMFVCLFVYSVLKSPTCFKSASLNLVTKIMRTQRSWKWLWLQVRYTHTYIQTKSITCTAATPALSSSQKEVSAPFRIRT